MVNDDERDKRVSKIDELNQAAWMIRVSDSDEASRMSKEAILYSKEIDYKKGLADGLRIEGFGYIRKSDFEKASECLENASAIYRLLNDLRGLAAVKEYFGIIERNKGNSALALEYIFEALQLSRQTGFEDNEVTNLYQAGVTYKSLANYENALAYLYQSLSLAESIGFTLMKAYNAHIIGSIYFETGDFGQALEYYKHALPIRQEAGDKWGEAGSLDNIGFTYLKLKDYPQAIDYCKRSLAITISTEDKKGQANALFHLAEACLATGDLPSAIQYSDESLKIRQAVGDRRGQVEILLFLASLHIDDQSETVEKLSPALSIASEINAPDLLSKIHFQLYEHYKKTAQFELGLKSIERHIDLEKQLHKDAINQKMLNLEITHNADLAKKESEAIQLRNKELVSLNEEIENQNLKLEQAFTTLKSAQAQLIQSEKMASLGILTAGIAHEIQNPLNFINNFSEVNAELLSELEEEARKGNFAAIKALASDLKSNEQKINHHGKRADAIVKGMLQHSRSSKGEKALTDINALADEYLRLSYHGLKANDKDFMATFETEFHETICEISVVPQDIGRVFLNLFNNAFYAVNERRKTQDLTFNPTVRISTKNLHDKVEISVSDNGNGIPEKALDRIFQPFFTTKPTGQGTGLGLSLSYDIVKAHGGNISVESKEGEGTTFVVQLLA